MDGFGDEVERQAGGRGVAEEAMEGSFAGEEEDFAAREGVLGGEGDFDAGEAGHGDVGDDEIRLKDVEEFDSGLAIVDGTDFVACQVEDGGEGFGDDFFVVGDEDADFVVRGTRIGSLHRCLILGVSHDRTRDGGRAGQAIGRFWGSSCDPAAGDCEGGPEVEWGCAHCVGPDQPYGRGFFGEF